MASTYTITSPCCAQVYSNLGTWLLFSLLLHTWLAAYRVGLSRPKPCHYLSISINIHTYHYHVNFSPKAEPWHHLCLHTIEYTIRHHPPLIFRYNFHFLSTTISSLICRLWVTVQFWFHPMIIPFCYLHCILAIIDFFSQFEPSLFYFRFHTETELSQLPC